MSATRTAQAYPGNQNLAAALGVVILAIAVMLVLAFGVLSASKATVSTPTSGAAPATCDHGTSGSHRCRPSRVGPGRARPPPHSRSGTTARSARAQLVVSSSESCTLCGSTASALPR